MTRTTGNRSVQEREELLRRFERWTEWPQTVLALALIPLLLAPYIFSLSTETQSTLEQLDYGIWGIFVADLLISLTIAPRRLHYLRTHWLDVVLVMLPMLRPLRSVRAFRALRAFAAVDRALVGARQILMQRGIQYVMISSIVIVVAAGSLATVFERDTDAATITSLPDGLWWAVTTVTTVGYGDTYPKTAAGRGLGVALMIVGVGLFGALTASLAAYFVEENETDLVAEIQHLRTEVRALSAALQDGEETLLAMRAVVDGWIQQQRKGEG